ncbi:MAG TPA: hypothetical protein VH165_20900 [Kofleriaceae bacterium]|nr:hypothetical protein [Kofleriaceae bacterium]
MLQRYAGIDLAHARAEHGSVDLSQVVPTQYSADAVSILRDAENSITSAVISEVQLRIDRDKEATWPLYVSALRAKLHCPVTLLVMVRSAAVGRWARAPIPLGHPEFVLKPIVLELRSIPAIHDASDTQGVPELAVLSALANPTLDVATAALQAISPLPADQGQLYLDVILGALSPLDRRVFMQDHVYQSEFARKFYSQGHSQGMRQAGLEIMQAKLDKLTSADHAALDSVSDAQALTALIGALARAKSPTAVRAALAAAHPAARRRTRTSRAQPRAPRR